MLALIGCTRNECPHWSAPCMPPVVPPHLGPAPAGLLSLVWAAKRRSASTSARSTRHRPCRAARLRMRRRKARQSKASLRARRRPPAAPAQRRRANRRATQSRVGETAQREKLLLRHLLLFFRDLLIADFYTVAEKAKNRELINNLNNKRNTTSLLPTSMSTSTAASQVKRVNVRGHFVCRDH